MAQKATSTRLLRKLAVFATLAVLMPVLQVSAPASAQGVEMEVDERELHINDPAQVTFRNFTPGAHYELEQCVSVGARQACNDDPFTSYHSQDGTEGRRERPVDRVMVLRNEIVDCAASEVACSLRYTDDSVVIERTLNFSSERPLPEITINSEEVRAGEPIELSLIHI